uniref:Putative q rich salivary secreted protein n=1 Tax=Anopheles marajoara TaxID=58244 RepID=A0A2M4BA31_9DIPT
MANEAAEGMVQGDNVARSKIEIEVESHVLGAKVKLSDGTEGNVFTRTSRNKDLQFVYSCHICGVPTLCGERMLQIHIAGRRHQARLSVSTLDAEQYRASLVMKPKQNPASLAGEGMAGLGANDSQEAKPVAQLQSVLDGYRAGPLVGLEYIVELKHQGPGEGVSYNCLLCDTRGNNESGITTHLIMPEHRLKFLEKHYATVMKVIAPYRSAPGADAKDSVFCRVVQTICEAIEDHHGRMAPSVYDADDFGRNRAKYIQGVKFGKHCDEQTGPKFVELIDKKVLQDLKATTAGGAGGGGQRKYRNRQERRGSLDSISSLSSANSVMSISSSGDNDDESRLRKKSPLNRGASQRGLSKPPPSIPTPKELSQQAAHIAHERYKWEKFRCTVELMKAPLLQQLKEYEKNPEKHPLYSEEWKKFWNRRYKELQAEKKDPSKHNFKPEWIEYWTKRMKELHDEEVERKKLEIRTKMNLPAEEEERTDELREQYTLRVPPNRPKERKMSLGGKLESDSEDEYKAGQPLVNSRSRKRSSPPMKIERSAHPWSSESSKRQALSHSHRSRSPYSEDIAAHRLSRLAPSGVKRPPPAQTPPERVDYDEWAKNYYGPNKKVFVRTDFDDASSPPTFIAVCRLLTAFEEYLGSLGPKVIDLLAKGLALEKVKANSADDLLLNEDNSMFLETVKEKLKGHLMAGTIDPPKIASIKRAVQNIASLLHEASKREAAPKPAEEEVSRDSLAVSEISGVATPAAPTTSASGPDKVTIAAQLAKALVAQGKTDFSTEELEQLINVYQAMVEMSRERKMIITTKAYLAACSSSAGPSNARTAAAVSKEVTATTASSGIGVPSSMMFDRNRSDPPMTTYANRRLQEMERKMTPEPIIAGKFRSSAMLENLSDSDLQTLLQTFKDLATDEQMHLITYLRKLERTEPDRVEKLRRYVDFETLSGPQGRGGGAGAGGRRGGQFDQDLSDDDDDDDQDSFRDRDDDAVGYDPFRANNDRQSPAVNPRNVARQDRSPQGIIQQGHSSGKQQQQRNNDPAVGVDQNKKKILVDSDDEDDYSYDDILRAASKNVTSQPPAKDVDGESNSNHSQRANAAGAGGGGGSVNNNSNTVPIPSLADTSNLVANLMESLQKSFSDAKNNAGSQDYSNPIMTIGSLGGGNGLDGAGHGEGGAGGAVGSIPAMNAFGSNMNGAGAGPGGPFFQRQQQQMHPQGPVRPMMQQQPMGGAFGQQAQMQQAFGGQQQFMYQGQQFGGNMNGQQQQQQQAAQFGYGNYGGYY